MIDEKDDTEIKDKKHLKKSFHEQVAEKLIEQLKQGTAPWQKPWKPEEPGAFLPINPSTGKRYKGINAIQLMSQNHGDQRWVTYKQAATVGAQVKKGEKGTTIQYWKFTEERNKRDANGKPVFDANGKPVKEEVKLERPRVFFATVFNAEQIEGLPPIEKKPALWNSVERAEKILQASGAVIRHIPENKAFYSPSKDHIQLPDKSQFSTADKYYATALHELGHWTGHSSRLDRDLSHPFGSEGYAKEELRAEISSMIMGDELGIGHDPEQHVSYVNSWIKILQNEPMEIFRAAADAEKIQDYVLGFEQKNIQELEKTSQQSLNFLTPAENAIVEAYILMKTTEDLQLHQAQKENFEKITKENLGFQLPTTWTGETKIIECIERFGITRPIDIVDIDLGEAPNAYRLEIYTQDETYTRIHDFYDFEEAAEMAQKIKSIHNTINQKIEDQKIQKSDDDFMRELMKESLNMPRKLMPITEEDMEISKILKEMRKTQDTNLRKLHEENFDRICEKTLGFKIPYNWTGSIMRRNTSSGEESNKQYYPEDVGLVEMEYPDFFEIHAITDENKLIKITQYVGAEYNSNEVREMEKRLWAIQSHSLTNENEQFINNRKEEIVLLNVPYKEKDEAKSLGAKWDRQNKSWCIPKGLDSAPFSKWLKNSASENTKEDKEQKNDNAVESEFRKYLVVPYGEREAAKAAGAFWDKSAKSWCAGSEAHMDKLSRWMPENFIEQQDPAISPREEFADALWGVGALVTGDHPIMDGQKHRIKVEGDKLGQTSGFYVGHLDGHPAGYIKNNRTSVDIKWKSKGYSLNPEQKAAMQAEAANKQQMRAAEQERQREEAAQRAINKMSELTPIVAPTPYMQFKGIKPQAGIFTDKEGQKTYIPVIDENGKQWSIQTIQADGTKRFAKNGRKEGCFHVVGGLEKLYLEQAIIIAEGYATAASLSEALEFNTVAAFDSGNLENVAKALHAKFPDKPIIIAGDNDQYLEITQGINPGKTKAEEAAHAVGGQAMFPIFTTGESEQAKISKKFTDFNDMANKSELGIEHFKRRVTHSVVNFIMKHKSDNAMEKKQQKNILQNNEKKREGISFGC